MHASPHPPPKIDQRSAATAMTAPTTGITVMVKGKPAVAQAVAIAVTWPAVISLKVRAPAFMTKLASSAGAPAMLLHGTPGPRKPDGGHGGRPAGKGGRRIG